MLRLILSGAFDRYPSLQFVIGHLGEALPFMLPRLERLPKALTKLDRPIGAYLRENFHYTFSGFNWTPTFLDPLLEVGVDRIMFSADYPWGSMARARTFLEELPLSPADRERIAHGNAERLLRVCALYASARTRALMEMTAEQGLRGPVTSLRMAKLQGPRWRLAWRWREPGSSSCAGGANLGVDTAAAGRERETPHNCFVRIRQFDCQSGGCDSQSV